MSQGRGASILTQVARRAMGTTSRIPLPSSDNPRRTRSPFAAHRLRSTIEALLAFIETRQQNRAVVVRPHSVVDLLETNRLAVQRVAEEQPRVVVPVDHARVVHLPGQHMAGML